jgi:hypothetical protein
MLSKGKGDRTTEFIQKLRSLDQAQTGYLSKIDIETQIKIAEKFGSRGGPTIQIRQFDDLFAALTKEEGGYKYSYKQIS